MTVLIIFILTYIGVAAGRIPILALDRTGIALLGAIAMIVSGAVSLQAAVESIDFPTIVLLYALMIVSAQLRLGGFYTRMAQGIAGLCARPGRFLLVSMAASAVLSAVLANDIICLAFTPVLALALVRAGLNPIPFLLGLAVASNIGSAATLIGNPQNMLIGQIGRLSFGPFLLWCLPPVVLAFAGSVLIIYLAYRRNWNGPVAAMQPSIDERKWPRFNAWQSYKGLAVVLVLLLLFFTSLPRELSAIGAAGVLLCSRKMKSRHIIELVDWHLITLFCGLFIVTEALSAADWPAHLAAGLAGSGVDIGRPGVLAAVSSVLSNLVSNVPAVMLLIRFLDAGDPRQWYVLALSSTFAGNLITVGSIANLIVIEQARACGIHIGFWTHARVGLLVTAWSLAVMMGWIFLH